MKHPHLLDSDKKASVIILVNPQKKVLLQLRDEHAPLPRTNGLFLAVESNPVKTLMNAYCEKRSKNLRMELFDPVLIIARCMDHPVFDEEYIYVEQVSDKTIDRIVQSEGADRGWFTYPQALQLEMVEDQEGHPGRRLRIHPPRLLT